MNPYKQIAREHLTTEELEELLAERKPKAEKMNYEEQRIQYYADKLAGRIK